MKAWEIAVGLMVIFIIIASGVCTVIMFGDSGYETYDTYVYCDVCHKITMQKAILTGPVSWVYECHECHNYNPSQNWRANSLPDGRPDRNITMEEMNK